MAVEIEPSDIVTVRLEFKPLETTDVAYNVLHYRMDTLNEHLDPLPSAVAAPADQVLATLAETMYGLWSNAWKTGGSIQCSMTGCTVQKIKNGLRSAPYTFTPGTAVAGLAEGEMLPLQDSPTVLKKTGYGERWGVGRIYFVGVSEDGQSNGILEPEQVTAMDDFIALVPSDVTSTNDLWDTTWEPVLYADLGTELRVTIITSAELSDDILKTQRRRRPGKGI